MENYEIHELSNCIPEMDEATFQKLKADVLGLGVIEPIILFEGKILDGRARFRASPIGDTVVITPKILDGRARFRAAQELFIDCPTKEYRGNSPVALLLALNVFRQHLTPEQSAATMERLKEPFLKNVKFRPTQENLFTA